MSKRYVLFNQYCNRYLAVKTGANGAFEPSASEGLDGLNTEWYIVPEGNGTFRISPAAAGTGMSESLQTHDIPAGDFRVTVETTDNKNAGQLWSLLKPLGIYANDVHFFTQAEYSHLPCRLAMEPKAGMDPPFSVVAQPETAGSLQQAWVVGACPVPRKQTIDLSVPNPQQTENYSSPGHQHFTYNAQNKCWSIDTVGGFVEFELTLGAYRGVNLIFKLRSGEVDGSASCPIDITVNGKLLVHEFDPKITTFYDMVWPVSGDMLTPGDNDIVVTLVGGKAPLFMSAAVVDMYSVSVGESNWLSNLQDYTLLSEINLPGTHDSAAINATASTPYACQNLSITDQLLGGIRVLDVRLKVQKDGGTYSFVTCHGDWDLKVGANEYQSFPSLMDECAKFLAGHGTETIVMSLKIDDWDGNDNDEAKVLDALASVLGNYPTRAFRHIPMLKEARDKIVLFNRINEDLRFGTPMAWPDNTDGCYADSSSNRSYNLYVQDRYKELPTVGANQVKYNDVTLAFTKKKPNEVLLNFASATWYGVIGVYIMGNLLNYFGKNDAAHRPATFGWTMLDFPFEQYQTDRYGWLDIVRFIIASNKGYFSYEQPFKVIGHDDL